MTNIDHIDEVEPTLEEQIEEVFRGFPIFCSVFKQCYERVNDAWSAYYQNKCSIEEAQEAQALFMRAKRNHISDCLTCNEKFWRAVHEGTNR